MAKTIAILSDKDIEDLEIKVKKFIQSKTDVHSVNLTIGKSEIDNKNVFAMTILYSE